MNTISRQNKGRRVGSVVAAAILATAVATPSAAADPLPVYGGATYSPSTGGYFAGDIGTGLSPSAHVNDAGMAVATASKYSSSGDWQLHRALRWSATSAATELGGGPNSVSSLRAERINAAGTAVGSAVVPNVLDPYGNPQQYRPARWAASGTAATILEHPYITNGAVSSYAATFLYDVNDTGTAVGTVLRTGYDQVGTPLDRGTRPGRWDGSGTALTELGVLGTDVNGITGASARAINAAGVAVGDTQKYDAGGVFLGTVAVRWDASGVAATELGHLGGSAPVGFAAGRAFAINSAGTAVGSNNVYGDAGNFLRHVPVRWDPSGTPTELGTLGPGGGFATVVWSPAALNDAGTAVGWAEYDDQGIKSHVAVRWEGSGTAATELGNLGRHVSGSAFSEASAVNAAGTTVGSAVKYVNGAPVDGYTHAVYWGADTFAIDLNTLIDPASGWLLTNALEISDTGWIVGHGRFDPDGPGGQAAYSRHFLMQVSATVPEPTGLALMLGAALLAQRRRVIS